MYATSSLISRILSTPLLDAASISSTSVAEPLSIDRQASQQLHGLPFTGDSQFIAFASIFAQVVFPVPREPQKRYACENLLFTVSYLRMEVICS